MGTPTDEASALVARAGGAVLTVAAMARLQVAVETHNDGRVRRHLRKAVAASDAGKADLWSRHLHDALDEAWPVGHPLHRRAIR